jgi:hypothetical protein
MAYEIDFLEAYDLDSIAAELRRVAKKLGKRTLTRVDVDRHGRLASTTVIRKFGSMQHAHEAAGLAAPRVRLSDKEMLSLVADLWKITHKKTGRSPTAREVKMYDLPMSVDTVFNRFGSWKKGLLAAAKFAPGRLSSAGNTPKPKMATPARPPISVRTRFLVFKRDGYQCMICRKAGGELELDHVIPVCRGGDDRVDNLQTLCMKCNRGKRGSLQ